MLYDITLPITREMLEDAKQNEKPSLLGHLGTHFDAMDKVFPLAYTKRNGIVFDVSTVGDREIGVGDIDMNAVSADMFVAFYTGFIEKVGYGSAGYFKNHPELSFELIDRLLEQGVSVIGLDFGGVRRGAEHTPADQRCADRGTFVVENLCGLEGLLAHGGRFVAHTYPLRFCGISGHPCRVLAEV